MLKISKSSSGGLNAIRSFSMRKSLLHERIIVILTFLILTTVVSSQSILTIESGASMKVLNGANMCVNIIEGPGILNGDGTLCGDLVSEKPIAPNEVPANFDMLQNYPNPFNPFTVIKYQLPKASYVSIKLYDPLGRLTAVLYEGNQQAGYFQEQVDGTNLASGIYFCRFNTGDYSKVIKMLLVK
jgi:hypothetical protein